MSFQLGTFDTDSIVGFKAILEAWPMLPVELHLDELPAGDGSLYYRSRMTENEWVFNLELTGSDVADVLAKADQISRALNPKVKGQQTFVPNAAEGWTWRGVLGGLVEWERDKILWFSDQGICRMEGQLTIVTPNPYGTQASNPLTIAAQGNLVMPTGGNTSYYPLIKFRGVLSAAQSFAMFVAGQGTVQVPGPLTVNDEFVFDFDKMEFYRFDRGNNVKLYNIADRFVSFARFEVRDAPLTIFCLTDGGTFTRVEGIPTFRRI